MARLSRTFAATILLAIAASVAAWLGLRAWAAGEREAAVERWRDQLSAMADDRSAATETWVSERLGDARLVAGFPTIIDLASRRHVEDHLSPGERGGALRHVADLLALVVDTDGYEGAWVVGGSPDLPTLAGTQPAVEDRCRDVVRRVLASGTPQVSIHLHGSVPTVSFAAPVWPAGAPGRPAGAVLFSVDPRGSGASPPRPAGALYGLLLHEPLWTRTGETVLVSADGPDVLFLSPLRHRPAPPLTFRRPMSSDGLAARAALLGQAAYGTFVDYRGVRVFAAVRRIPGTTWGLVVKVDQAEALEGYRVNVWRTAVAGAGLLLAFAGIGFGLWRAQAASARLSLVRSEARFGLLLENAEDAILFVRPDGRILEANQRLEELLGYTRTELLGMRLHDILPPDTRPLVTARMEGIRRQGGLVFETAFLVRDGTTIPSEVSSRFAEMDGGGVFLTVVRDIRERKAAQTRIAFLNRVLRTLTEVNELMVRETGREGLLHGACRILVEHGGFRMAWIGLLDPDTHWVVPAAFAGFEDGYLSEVVTGADGTELGGGPAGVCIREGRSVSVADLAIDESSRPWREPALRRGYSSVASVPIRMQGAVAGVLSLYSERAWVFDSEVVERIEGLADDIGFALESIDARREREEATRALAESKTFFEALINAAPLAVFTVKPDGRVGAIWNPAAERMFGWSRQEAIGRPLPFVPPESQEEFRALRGRVLMGESISNVELIRRRRDGTPIEISIATAPITSPDGRVVDMLSVVADVTDRNRMGAALRESEARFKRLAENAPDVIYRFRVPPDPGFEYINPAITAITGYRPEEFYADPGLLLRIMHPDDQHLLHEAAHGVVPPGAPTLARWFRRDGTLVWTEIRNISVRDTDGRVVALEGISRDVTVRVEAEQSLRQLSAAVEQSSASVMITDVAGNIEYVNPAFARLTGYRPDEVKGQNPRILKSDRTPPETYEELWKTITAGREWRGELLNRKKNGDLYWEYASISAIVNAEGRATHFLAVKEDITARKQAEEALAHERNLLDNVITTIPDNIYFKDPESRFIRINHAMARWFGLRDPNEAVGKTDGDFFGAEHAQQAHADEQRVMATGEPVVGQEEKETWPDGRITWVSTSKAPIRDAAGQIVGLVGVSRDITGRKRAEEELHQAQEQLLQSQKIEAVGRLAGGVAHDFNNLLGVIIGYGEMAAAAIPPRHRARARLEHILTAAMQAADLTRQLLAFSRRQVLQPRVLDLKSVVMDTEKLLRRLIGEDVELVVRLAPEPSHVKVDPGQFAQVLMNLAVNARDAMPNGGVLTIETANLDVDPQYARAHAPIQPGRYVQLRVKDTGVGMDEAVRQRIFEPFFTTKPEGVGTGLGLSTVYGIVKQSGGYVWVESAPGRGATFTIHLPRVEGPEEPKGEPSDAKVRAKGAATVLVVEDQDNLRELICEILEDNGYSVLGARDAHEALSLVEDHPRGIDLLLTDVVMPGMSGHELVEQLKPRHPAMRVLYMSGYTSDVIAGRGVLEEGLHLIEKPFTSLALTRRVRQVLDDKDV